MLILLLSWVNGTAATDLPSHVAILPVAQAQCLALHPTKPVLYVGRAEKKEGKNLTTFALDERGGVIATSRVDYADGLVAVQPVPEALEYTVIALALNPALPQLYVAAKPRQPRAFRPDTNTCVIAAFTLDERGMPAAKIEDFPQPKQKIEAHTIDCDPQGRWIYLGQSHAYLALLPVGDVEIVPMPRVETRRLPERALLRAKPKPATTLAKDHLVRPVLKVTTWSYVAQWKRYYGVGQGTKRIVFTFGDDGRVCTFAQGIESSARSPTPPLVSVKHQKFYSPNALGSKLGVYQLTRDGRLTSVPRYFSIDPIRVACVDEPRGLLYATTSKGMLSIYSLDAEGYPTAKPQQFELQSGAVNDMVLSPKTGTLYLACTAPVGGKS